MSPATGGLFGTVKATSSTKQASGPRNGGLFGMSEKKTTVLPSEQRSAFGQGGSTFGQGGSTFGQGGSTFGQGGSTSLFAKPTPVASSGGFGGFGSSGDKTSPFGHVPPSSIGFGSQPAGSSQRESPAQPKTTPGTLNQTSSDSKFEEGTDDYQSITANPQFASHSFEVQANTSGVSLICN
jgi:hypothetical protein